MRTPALFILAGTLASVAFLVRGSALRAEKKNPPRGRFTVVDGVRLHYTDTGGSGQAVVLLHGNGVTSLDWEIAGITEKIRGKYRVIAFDRPGFGYSERPRNRAWMPDAQADLIKHALQKIGISKPVIAGHSYGAIVAAAFALRHADFTRGVLLASGYYFPTFRADVFIYSAPAIPLLGDVLRYTLFPLIGRFFAPAVTAKVFAPQLVPARFREQYPLELSLRPWQLRATGAETAFMIAAAAELERYYETIKTPAVILTGDSDQIADPQRQSARLHSVMHRSKLRVIPGAGHMIHYAAGDVFANAIDELAGGRGILKMLQIAQASRA